MNLYMNLLELTSGGDTICFSSVVRLHLPQGSHSVKSAMEIKVSCPERVPRKVCDLFSVWPGSRARQGLANFFSFDFCTLRGYV